MCSIYSIYTPRSINIKGYHIWDWSSLVAQQVKNPPDRWVWWATVQRVAESQTRLSNKVSARTRAHTHTYTHTHMSRSERRPLIYREARGSPQTSLPTSVPKSVSPQRLLWECWAPTDLCRHRWSIPEKRGSQILKLSILRETDSIDTRPLLWR